MRDLVLLFGLIASVGFIFRYPFAGVLAWGWLSFMVPQTMSYGFLSSAPINFGIAILTLAIWLLSKERKGLPDDMLPRLMLLMVLWMLLNSYFAPHPEWSQPKFEVTMKTYPFIFLCLAMTNTKARIHALVLVLVISLTYFGGRGGLYTILSGGTYHMTAAGSIYIDNNQMALALVMGLPLLNYLRETSANRLVRMSCTGAIVMQMICILGSYSRGGLLALAGMATLFWFRSRRKLFFLIMAVIFVFGTLSLMPAAFFERMNTIKHAEQDDSFMTRVESWQVCFHYAVDHFPFGAGFNGTLFPEIFHSYFPAAKPIVAHSIYFQVLGDNGFPGLFLYLCTLWLSWRNARLVSRRCKSDSRLAWAARLASALEVGIFGYAIGGAALSVPYWDGFLTVQAMTSILREMTDPKRLARTVESPESQLRPLTSPGVGSVG